MCRLRNSLRLRTRLIFPRVKGPYISHHEWSCDIWATAVVADLIKFRLVCSRERRYCALLPCCCFINSPLPLAICFLLDRKRRGHVKWEENGKRFVSEVSDSFKLVAQISSFIFTSSYVVLVKATPTRTPSIRSDTPHRSQMTKNKVLWERRMNWTRKGKRTVWQKRTVRTETKDFENRFVIIIREGPQLPSKSSVPWVGSTDIISGSKSFRQTEPVPHFSGEWPFTEQTMCQRRSFDLPETKKEWLIRYLYKYL